MQTATLSVTRLVRVALPKALLSLVDEYGLPSGEPGECWPADQFGNALPEAVLDRARLQTFLATLERSVEEINDPEEVTDVAQFRYQVNVFLMQNEVD